MPHVQQKEDPSDTRSVSAPSSHKLTTRAGTIEQLMRCTGVCVKYGLQCASRWCEYYGREHPVMENDEVKILWDFNVESEQVIVHRRPHIVLLEKKEKNTLLIDVAVPGDVRVEEKRERKWRSISVSHAK